VQSIHEIRIIYEEEKLESRTQTPATDPTTAVDRAHVESMRGMQAAMKIRSVSI